MQHCGKILLIVQVQYNEQIGTGHAQFGACIQVLLNVFLTDRRQRLCVLHARRQREAYSFEEAIERLIVHVRYDIRPNLIDGLAQKHAVLEC